MGHTLTRIRIHLVFSTKHREKSIREEYRSRLYSYMASIFNDWGCYCDLINGTNDHVHILFTLKPSVALSDLVQCVKSRSSMWYKEIEPTARYFSWQSGYSAFAVSPSFYEKTLEYIREQEEHHKEYSSEIEFQRFLKANQMKFDPHYLDD